MESCRNYVVAKQGKWIIEWIPRRKSEPPLVRVCSQILSRGSVSAIALSRSCFFLFWRKSCSLFSHVSSFLFFSRLNDVDKLVGRTSPDLPGIFVSATLYVSHTIFSLFTHSYSKMRKTSFQDSFWWMRAFSVEFRHTAMTQILTRRRIWCRRHSNRTTSDCM